MERLIVGIVYSEFDDKIGPTPISIFPSDIKRKVKNLVSLKSMSLVVGEEDFVPESLTFIPFPSINLKGIVKFLSWKDENARGGEASATISLLFEEPNDLIFYKYVTDLEFLFELAADSIIKLRLANEDTNEIETEIKGFFEQVDLFLNGQRKKELGAIAGGGEFPDEDNKEKESIEDLYSFKIAVLGDPSVGKTSSILRFTDNAFKRTYIPTIGTNITEKRMQFDDIEIKLVIWDIAGQSKFSVIRKHFYQGTDAIILIFDLTRPETFESIPNWYKDLETNLKTPNLICDLCGNKNDLIKERKITKESAQECAIKYNLDYFETSALSGDNIEQVFKNLGKKLIAFGKRKWS
jgi:small GTP-binding protein